MLAAEADNPSNGESGGVQVGMRTMFSVVAGFLGKQKNGGVGPDIRWFRCCDRVQLANCGARAQPGHAS